MAGRVDKTGSGPGRTGASSVTRSPDRSLADRSTSFTGPTGQIMDTRRVEPISGSDPMNAALQPITNSRSRRTTSSLPIGATSPGDAWFCIARTTTKMSGAAIASPGRCAAKLAGTRPSPRIAA
jgi:hypothetical protein